MPRSRARVSAPAPDRSEATSTTSPPRRAPRAPRCVRIAPRFEPPPDARTAMRDRVAGSIGATAARGRSREAAVAERREDARRRIGEGWRDLGFPRGALALLTRRLLGRDEYPAPAEGAGRRDVPPHVADEERRGAVESVIRDRLLVQQHPGLATGARLIDRRSVRTHVRRVDAGALRGEQVV